MERTENKKLHYVKIPENHIVIDFDIKDKELSKSCQGIHLHYIYTGKEIASEH